MVFHSKWIILVHQITQRHLCSISPSDLVNDRHRLTDMAKYPYIAIITFLIVLVIGLLDLPLHCENHIVFKRLHPLFDALSPYFKHSIELQSLTFQRLYAVYILKI